MEESSKWHYVYILYSLKDFKLYVGTTINLKKRLERHNSGMNTSTKGRCPLILIFAESFLNKKDADNREKFYKTGRGREIIKMKLENTFVDLDKKYKQGL